MAFKLRSGNKSSFKSMGSSPAKQVKDKVGPVAEKNIGKSEDFLSKEEAIKYVKDVLSRRATDRKVKKAYKTLQTKKESPAKQIELALLRKRKGLGPREIQGEDDQSYGAAVTRKEMGVTKEYPYYYKINGQNVSKEAYVKYENKPGGDEPGKQTNDPDVYGRKANNHGRGPKTK